VPKAIPGDVVVLNLDDEFGLQGLPGVLLTLIPSAAPPGADPVKPGGDQSSSFFVRAGRSAAAMPEVKPT
jgi:hypothetical protein